MACRSSAGWSAGKFNAVKLYHSVSASGPGATPPGTPLVFVTDSPDTRIALFRLSHLLNVARAALPTERAGDVYSFLGRPQDLLAGQIDFGFGQAASTFVPLVDWGRVECVLLHSS